MPETKTISGGGLSVTVSAATMLIGLRRTRLIIQAGQGEPDSDPDMLVARRIIYPALVAAVADHAGFEAWPIPFEEFLALDEGFAAQWEQAVFELNPHWLSQPDTPATVAGEKKEPRT